MEELQRKLEKMEHQTLLLVTSLMGSDMPNYMKLRAVGAAIDAYNVKVLGVENESFASIISARGIKYEQTARGIFEVLAKMAKAGWLEHGKDWRVDRKERIHLYKKGGWRRLDLEQPTKVFALINGYSAYCFLLQGRPGHTALWQG